MILICTRVWALFIEFKVFPPTNTLIYQSSLICHSGSGAAFGGFVYPVFIPTINLHCVLLNCRIQCTSSVHLVYIKCTSILRQTNACVVHDPMLVWWPPYASVISYDLLPWIDSTFCAIQVVRNSWCASGTMHLSIFPFIFQRGSVD